MRRAFTIVEILVVVAIVLVLLSIIVVAVGSATRTAQRTNTGALMSSIKQALVHFENEVGYLPPVLDHRRNLEYRRPSGAGAALPFHGPDPGNESAFKADIQQWHSVTSLAEYLIGYGPEEEDGHSGPGIRHPGPDGYWGATNPVLGTNSGKFRGGRSPDENSAGGWLNPSGPFAAQSAPYREGRVYGPYMQLRDERLLGAIDPQQDADANGRFRVFFPGEAGYDDTWPKVIVDYWGEPVRYYRKPHPPGAINREYRRIQGQNLVPPTLADAYLLRPYDIREDRRMDSRFGDAQGDPSATYELQNAQFALFSSGPDRRFNPEVRYDALFDGFNRDNIVELGP